MEYARACALFVIYGVIVFFFFVARREHWSHDTRGTVAVWALGGLAFYLLRDIRRIGDGANNWLVGGDMAQRLENGCYLRLHCNKPPQRQPEGRRVPALPPRSFLPVPRGLLARANRKAGLLSMYAVVPRQNDEMHRLALLGILGSGVASAWVAFQSATRMINADTLRDLPFPPMKYWRRIAAAMAAVVTAVTEGAESASTTSKAVRILERAVVTAYGMSEDDRRLIEIFDGASAPEGVERYPSREDAWNNQTDREPDVGLAGSMLGVRRGQLRLHVPGVTPPRGKWVHPPRQMPGWLARPGATFDVTTTGPLEQGRFRFQTYGWVDADSLA